MRLVGRGHPAIRATHAKTLEFTADREITARATCVVAVGVSVDGLPLAGSVRIAIRAGGHEFELDARADSGWAPSGSAVVRRSPLRLPGTLATHASAAAADLPRDLVEALRDPATEVEVTVEPVAGPPCAVLCATGIADRQLQAELAAADLIVAEDEAAARLVGERVAAGEVTVDGRVLVLAATELPGRTVADTLRHADVETVGLSPPLAAAAASPSRAPVLLVPAGADPKNALRTAPAATRLVVRAPAADIGRLVNLALEARGEPGAVVVQPFAPPLRITAGVDPALPGKDDAYVCFDAATGAAALDPRIRAAVTGLLADGVPTKAAASALAALTGWDRRRAYAAVLDWTT